MFSYRHVFHAGNHADVLKHIILVELLNYMRKKDKGFSYIDTHAGAGLYPITSIDSTLNSSREFENGIKLLIESTSTKPKLVGKYLKLINAYWFKKKPSYPGSPFIAWQFLRSQDSLEMCEWHPSEVEILKNNFSKKTISPSNIKTSITRQNGFTFLKKTLPPKQKRALIFIDPSYEDKSDYKSLETTLLDGIRRFSTGVFAIWYPLIARHDAYQLPYKLTSFCQHLKWLHLTLNTKISPTGYIIPKLTNRQFHRKNSSKMNVNQKSSLYGSGMLIINPPYTLEQKLQSTLPYLVKVLAQDKHAGFTLEKHGQ